MDINLLESSIKKKQLEKMFYIFSGKEDFLKERVFENLVSAYVPSEDRIDNVFDIDLSQMKPEDFFGKLFSFSFNQSHRLFHIRNIEDIVYSQRKVFIERMCVISEKVSNVIFIINTAETRTASEISRILGDKSDKTDFWPPFENQMIQWVQKEARYWGGEITIEAGELLLHKVGTQLRLLSREISKLCTARGKAVIDVAGISAGVGNLRQDSIFDLLARIRTRNLIGALETLENLLQKGEPVIKIWFMIVKTVRSYRLLHDLAVDRPDLLNPIFDNLKTLIRLHGKSDFHSNQEKKNLVTAIQTQIAEWPGYLTEATGLDQAFEIKNLAFALKYSRLELCRLWPKLLEIDLLLKSSPPNDSLVLQKFVTELISKDLNPPSWKGGSNI